MTFAPDNDSANTAFLCDNGLTNTVSWALLKGTVPFKLIRILIPYNTSTIACRALAVRVTFGVQWATLLSTSVCPSLFNGIPLGRADKAFFTFAGSSPLSIIRADCSCATDRLLQ
jgi:hypothetical protein